MPKNTIIVTPKGVLKFPRLFVPDTKFKAEGEYKTSLILTPEEAQPLIDQLKAIHSEGYAAMCAEKKKKTIKLSSMPWRKETDKEGVETGNIQINAALKARVTPKNKEGWDQRPAVLDSKKKPVPASTNIGNGTTAKLALEINPWFTDALGFGIQLRLRAVQIIDLVEFSSNGASNLFSEESGYESPTSSAEDVFDDAPVSSASKSTSADF